MFMAKSIKLKETEMLEQFRISFENAEQQPKNSAIWAELFEQTKTIGFSRSSSKILKLLIFLIPN